MRSCDEWKDWNEGGIARRDGIDIKERFVATELLIPLEFLLLRNKSQVQVLRKKSQCATHTAE